MREIAGMARRAGKKLSDLIVWAILGLLIVGLAGFGIGNFGGSVTDIGRVGTATISAREYARALNSELRAGGRGRALRDAGRAAVGGA